ncbi:MAG: hypothetical protein EPN69_16280 [Rhodanobacter sp.]|nr:MAG: hypothetical protein EPN69_16280 [Rhodanobacter sp.]TAL99389.1 MAG: hypothetical protein EPN71_07655 [Rhodanobacter sp.]TAM40273.1 MAG: hypothetical protein EPN58_10925 [Rhodanobacter sp.]
MKIMRRTVLLAITTLSLSACIMLSSSTVTVKSMSGGPTGPRVVTFLNATPYFPEMTEALAENGFTVKPMASQQYVTKNEGGGKIGQYNEASTRYGLTLLDAPTTFTCALTSHAVYNFTLMVTDITRNQIVLILKQKGSDGPCTTIKPVFPTLSEALSNAWR